MEVIQYRAIQGAELRADTENRAISGYGIVFNSDSLPLHIWDERRGIVEVVEQITPDSLRGADMTDVISAFNHNFEKIMGRTSSGTMKITRDAKGIKYRVEAPKTSYADDVLELLQRGDLGGSSFVFVMDWEEGYEIEERADGTLLAKPKKIKKIYEMGVVINPAYPETTAENRSRTSALEQAVKRFLTEKEEAQKREQEQKEAEQRAAEQVEAEVHEEKDITYPVIVHYKYRAKVDKYKKRV